MDVWCHQWFILTRLKRTTVTLTHMTQCTNNTITWAQMADCSCCIAALRSASFMMLWSVNLLGWRLEPVWCHTHTGNGKSFKFICFALRQCATLPGDTVRWVLMTEVSARAYGIFQTLRRTRSAIIGVWNPASVCRISQTADLLCSLE